MYAMYVVYYKIEELILVAVRSKAWVFAAACFVGLLFESPRGHSSLSLVRVVCCQVEFSMSV